MARTWSGSCVRAGRCPPARVVHVLRQACGALSEAHARGLIHCDVKLENLMLCRQGGRPDVLKVLDFGLARNVARSGSGKGDGKAYGTPLTMAPEVIRGQEIGPTTDLYSLGAVAYYLVTGVPPYRGDTIGEVLVQHLRADPEPPSRLRPEVPSDLEDVILHCLAKERLARPASAAELESALAGCTAVGAWSLADAEAWWEAHAERVRESADPQASGGGHRSLATVGVTTIR